MRRKNRACVAAGSDSHALRFVQNRQPAWPKPGHPHYLLERNERPRRLPVSRGSPTSGPKGSPPTSLHNIAATATRFCSEAIRSRFQQAVSAQDVQVLAKEDQARTEQRAFAIGLELRESRNVGGGQLKPGCDGAIRLGGHHHPAQHCPPPSTRSTWPDTNAPSGPANTSTTRATSSTVAMRSSVPASTIRF